MAGYYNARGSALSNVNGTVKKNLFTRPTADTNARTISTGANSNTGAVQDYATKLKSKLATAGTAPGTQPSFLNTPVAASSASLSNPTRTATPTNIAETMKAARGAGQTGGSVITGLASRSSGLADMLARARGLRGGYSGDGSVQTSSQSSGQGNGSTPFKYMSLDEATGQAKDKLDPTYNGLRDRQDMTSSQDREQIAQQLAARFGMAGLHGGRSQSSYDQNTQAHQLAINDIEDKRATATAEMAQAIQDKDYIRAFQAYQLKKQLEYQQQQLEMQQEQFDQTMDLQQSQFGWTKEYQTQQLQMQKDAQTMSNEQFMLNYGLSKDEFALKEKQSNFDMDMTNKEYDWKTNPDTWYNKLYTEGANLDNDYKAAQINKLASSGSGGGGSGGGGSGSGSSSGGIGSKASKELADAVISDMQNEKLYLINNGGNPDTFSQYMAQSITDAQNQGVWDLISATDKARIYAIINGGANYDTNQY